MNRCIEIMSKRYYAEGDTFGTNERFKKVDSRHRKTKISAINARINMATPRTKRSNPISNRMSSLSFELKRYWYDDPGADRPTVSGGRSEAPSLYCF